MKKGAGDILPGLGYISLLIRRFVKAMATLCFMSTSERIKLTRNLEAFYRDYAESDPKMSPRDRGAQERIWLEDAKLLRISQQPPKDMETLPLCWGDIHEDGS